MSDPYSVLGVSRDATQDDIKRAYKKLAMKEHPDRGGDAEKFKKIAEAYEILSDEGKRQQYDNPGPTPGDIFGMFGEMFGQRSNCLPDHMKDVHIPLERAFTGTEIKFKVTLQTLCSCVKSCDQCRGTGTNRVSHPAVPFMAFEQPCLSCGSSGVKKSGCSMCKNGSVQTEKTVQINVPKGVQSGHHILLEGLGPQKKKPSDVPGNLVIRIVVDPHPVFERDGDVLVFKPKISFIDSVLGIPIVVPHFAGEFIVDTRTFGILDPRKFYEVKGRGMNQNANLKIQFQIEYPDQKGTDEIKLKLSRV